MSVITVLTVAAALATVIGFAQQTSSSDTTQPPAPNSLVQAWAFAIARMEGFYTSGTISNRQNNPGNIRAGSGYATYADAQAGWSALYSDLAAKLATYPTWSWAQIMERYAPASDGNSPNSYAQFVVDTINSDLTINLTVDTTLGDSIAMVNA